MSLLLDALKRAEEAKRAKGQEPAPGESPGRMTAPLAAPALEELSLDELSLEDYPAAVAERAPPSSPNVAKPVLDFTRDMPQSAGSATPSAIRATRQDSSPQAVTSVARAEYAQREAAQNMFVAKQNANNSAQTNRNLLLPLIAFLIVGAGGAVWYVWNEVARYARGTAPAVAARAAPGPLAPAAPTTGQIAKVADAASPVTQALPPLLPPPTKEQAALRTTSGRVAVGAGTPFGERERLAQSLKDNRSRVPKEAPVSLRLSQNIDPRVNPEVLEAYAALRRGDFVQAKRRYEQVLGSEPLNLDAHLGLATAAARSGENVLAARHYRRALDIDPRNGAALAGMVAVSNNINPQALEIELKTLIEKDPGSAALQFSLGNVYAGDRRWREAQQAYFEAYRLESENADYRYNLAVALDQLKQSKLALDYYQQALVQAAKSGGQFERAAVERRIAELKAP